MSVGGDNRPFQPKYYQYGKCERPSNGQYGLKVPILHNTTTQSTSPLDIWGDSTVTTGTASNAFDYNFSQVKSVKVTNGGTGWSTGDTFTPHFADGTNTTPPYAGYPYPMSSDNHGVSFPLLECTATSGSDGVMVSASIVRNSAGCFFSGAVSDNTAVSPSAGGSGATIALTFESASYDFGANCCQTGHGYVAACRSWHGCPGFLDSNMGGFNDTFCFTQSYVGSPTLIAKQWQSYQATPSSTKYCTLVVDMTRINSYTGHTGVDAQGGYLESAGGYTTNGGYTNSVDPKSGKVTQTVHPFTQFDRMWAHTHTDVPFPHPTDIPDYYQWYGYLSGSTNSPIPDPSGSAVPATGSVTVIVSSNYGLSASFTLSNLLPLSTINAPVGYGINEIDTQGCGWNWTQFQLSPGLSGYTDMKTVTDGGKTSVYTTTITRTMTSFHWSYETTYDDGSGNTGDDLFSGTITLSNPNESGDVVADIENNLLSPWILNPEMIPLSNDIWNGICTKVCRNEVVGPITPWLLLNDYTPQVDTSTYNGSIIGSPIGYTPASGSTSSSWSPTGYPADYYDQYYNNPTSDPTTGGGWRLSAGAQISPYSTHWTTTAEGQYLPFARCFFYNQVGVGEGTGFSGQIWITKLVEGSIRVNSYNHAHPYGSDWTKQTQCQDASQCGDYVPSASYTLVPPMAGRIAIQSVTSGSGSFFFATDPTPVLLDYLVSSATTPYTWLVDICDRQMNLIGSPVVPTTVSGSTSLFSCPTSSVDYTSAKWIVLQGALPSDPTVGAGVTSWYWCDDHGKGQGYLSELHSDMRISREADRYEGATPPSSIMTGCDNTTPLTGWPTIVQPNNGIVDPSDNLTRYGYRNCHLTEFQKGWMECGPWLIVLSGNGGDTPCHGILMDFSASDSPDETYGNASYLTEYQSMVDPTFTYSVCNAPPTCIPRVEARFNMPVAGWSGSEAAPSGGQFIDYTKVTSEFTPNSPTTVVPPAVTDQPTSWSQFCLTGYYVTPCGS